MYEVIHEMHPEYKRYYTVHMSIEWLNLYMIWQRLMCLLTGKIDHRCIVKTLMAVCYEGLAQ